eukprot:CAMPEP_0113498688 /NCGR_PEP_ID=MMETSP0014_2-20120614/31318_1 /TAXON_ID=2857 /ORGANISM="Nitzschia sp." /LENGTH=535 /DNA_ID=CAMNT_0000392753 /DNA_START=253 /DNA_END=1860 /DNA_ORIENTATION=+ /assembly_acc=CAM_ASM_000159
MPRLGGAQTAASYLMGGKRSSTGALPVTNEYIPAAPSSGNGGVPPRPLSSSFRSNTRSFSGGSRMSELPMTQQNNSFGGGGGNDQPRRTMKQHLNASESGKGSLLPDFNAPMTPTSQSRSRREAPNRSKSATASLLGGMRQTRKASQGLPQTQQDLGSGSQSQSAPARSSLSLRRRGGTAASDDEFDAGSVSGVPSRRDYRTDNDAYYTRRRATSMGNVTSTGRGSGVCDGKKGIFSFRISNISRVKIGHILQVVIVLAVTALVWESHHKALFAAHQLTQFKQEESLLLLHLQKIEQQSIQLHETIGRLAKVGVSKDASDKDGNGEDSVDFDLIHKQTQQLYQMEEELNHEVKTLQTRIQQSARNHIIEEFGEGPVQVILELDFGNPSTASSPSRIAILLWHDTPHAAWTLLEQIGRHVWDDADFQWTQGHIIDAVPHVADPMGSKIEFVEQSQHGHEAWTVGVRESENGIMGMYINLQDNTNLHKHETCVGKVIDGFDALQRLLEVARTQRYEDGKSIKILKASAMHVAKKEGV